MAKNEIDEQGFDCELVPDFALASDLTTVVLQDLSLDCTDADILQCLHADDQISQSLITLEPRKESLMAQFVMADSEAASALAKSSRWLNIGTAAVQITTSAPVHGQLWVPNESLDL